MSKEESNDLTLWVKKKTRSDRLEDIRKLCVSIVNDNRVKVDIVDTEPTAQTNLKRIILTHRLIPENVRHLEYVVDRMLDGEAIHECVPEGDPILTVNGISKMGNEDLGEVLSSNGHMLPPVRYTKRPYEGDLVEVKPWLLPSSRVTPNHKVLTKDRGWVPAGELTVNDRVLVPRLVSKWTHREDYQWLMGIYMAEGSASKDTVTISLGNHEQSLIKRVMRIGKTFWGVGHPIKGDSCTRILFYNTQLAKSVRKDFGTQSIDKHIPKVLMEQTNPKPFLMGWLAGDGHRESSGRWQLSTSSMSAAYQAILLGFKAGFKPSFYTDKRDGIMGQIKGRTFIQHDRFRVNFNLTTTGAYRNNHPEVISDKRGYWVKVHSIQRVPFNGTVCNLTVPPEHDYWLSFVVANCGHWIKSSALVYEIGNFIDDSRNHALAHSCQNIVEDRRVNGYMTRRYRWDIAPRLELLLKVTGDSMLSTVLDWIKTGNLNTSVDPVTKQAKEPGDMLATMVNCIAAEGLYMKDTSEIRKYLPDDVVLDVAKGIVAHPKQDIDICVQAISESEWKILNQAVTSYYYKLYRVLTKYSKVMPRDKVVAPTGTGGSIASRELLRELAELDASYKKKALEEALKEKDSSGHTGIGVGLGLEMEKLDSDMKDYLERVARLQPIINKMLKRMKIKIRPMYRPIKYQRKGRLMTEVLGKAYIQSRYGVLRNMYSGLEKKIEDVDIALGLMVDLSGSMNTDEAKDILTIISEVAGRWLRDTDFSIYVFGSNFARVKDFNESYFNSRGRVGGVQCMGGTELLYPLISLREKFRAMPQWKRKVLVIASDFQTSQDKKCQELLDQMRKDGTTPIGIAMCQYGDLDYVKTFTKDNTLGIDKNEELPDRFFEVYRKVAHRWGYGR